MPLNAKERSLQATYDIGDADMRASEILQDARHHGVAVSHQQIAAGIRAAYAVGAAEADTQHVRDVLGAARDAADLPHDEPALEYLRHTLKVLDGEPADRVCGVCGCCPDTHQSPCPIPRLDAATGEEASDA